MEHNDLEEICINCGKEKGWHSSEGHQCPALPSVQSEDGYGDTHFDGGKQESKS